MKESRLAGIRALMEEKGLDAVVINKLVNLHYFSGFTGDDTLLVITKKTAQLVTDFRYMEQVRVEYLESVGVTVQPKGSAPVLINASCTFLVPLTYPGTVEIRMYFGALGRSSVHTSYEIRIQGDEMLYATGEAKIVWMDVETGKSVPIPDDLRARMTARVGDNTETKG